jgi:hypothetical protein
MEAKNLAIVFAPTLLRPTGNDPMTTLNDATKSQRIIELLVLHYDDLFVVRPGMDACCGLLNAFEQKKNIKAKENQRTQKFNKNLKLGTIRLAASLLEEQKRRLEEEEAAELAAGGGAAPGASPAATPGRELWNAC